METSLHRQLKEFYCGDEASREVTVGEYRVDAVVAGQLIEIQQASLAALRTKVTALVSGHDVIVVKPLAAHKTLLRRDRKGGPIVARRASPRHETLLDLFQDLVHFVEVFPHPRLVLEVLLTEQEEIRVRRKKRKRWEKDYRIEDRKLVGICSRHVLTSVDDLRGLLPTGLEDPFTTAELAKSAGIPRWLAQKMAYCLRKTGAIAQIGKHRNAILYTGRTQECAAA